jgi:LmbE family N-acetylglucosaminyl deacetylase
MLFGVNCRTLLFLLLPPFLCAAEPLPEDRGAAGLWQSLKKLGTTARVMHITAHPDDEDGGMLTLLARGRGVDATLLSLTRGEAGANQITGDFFDALGALRTAELLKAAEYYGVRVRFTRFVDYGFSKNVAETFRKWDREKVLEDVVRIIRTERPHILISRWQGTPRDGHGNHEAAGVIAQLAFEAAGDPKRFSEQIAAGLPAWKPLKLYSNNRRQSDDFTLVLDSGVYDPVLGRSYAQVARDGLRFQRTQGAGAALLQPGPSLTYYKRIASGNGIAARESDFFEGTELATAARYPALQAYVARAVSAFSFANPAASAEALAGGLAEARKLAAKASNEDSYTLRLKVRQLEHALTQSLGMELDAAVEPGERAAGEFSAFRPFGTLGLATPGSSFSVKVAVPRSGDGGAVLEKVELVAPEGWKIERVDEGRFRVMVPAGAAGSKAYWSRNSIQETTYHLDNEQFLGMPLPPPPLRALATCRYAGTAFTIEGDVETSYLDASGIQRRRTLWTGPAVSLKMSSAGGVLPVGKRSYSVTGGVRNLSSGPVTGTIRPSLPPGWLSDPSEVTFRVEQEKQESPFRFEITAPAGVGEGEYPVEMAVESGAVLHRSSFEAITQPGLQTVHLAMPARHSIRVVDVKIAAGLKVGYVMGTGDEIPEALRQLGVTVELIGTPAISSGDLSQYDTILLGIRAYAARQDVKTYNSRLLDYVRNGGVLIVQYNTQEFDKNYGPYPYSMTMRAEEVSEEDSPVTILQPEDPVFRIPNKITTADFEGWVEQRGSKFWAAWDPAYKPLLSTHDTGQPPQQGGWLAARYGKGLYVYCAYSWYRQLPYTIPGAYRIFANLISLGKTPR